MLSAAFARDIGQVVAHRHHRHGATQGASLKGAHHAAQRSHQRQLLHDLARHGGVHVEDEGDAGAFLDAHGHEDRLFDRVHDVVAARARHAHRGGGHPDVTDQLLDRKARLDPV